MTGQMITFETTGGATAPGYLATPTSGSGPGVVVLHAWWGLTEPFRQTCDRLAEAGYSALAPDLYRGQTTAAIEEADQLAGALDDATSRADVAGAIRYLRQSGQPGAGPVALIGFSLGGAYALSASVEQADDAAAVVIFYATYGGLDFTKARAVYQFHFAERDPFEPAEAAAEMERALQEAGRAVTAYTYPNTTHWFFEPNRPDAYNAAAAALAWDRALALLNATLRG